MRRTVNILHILAAGDVVASAGTRSYLRELIYHLQLQGHEVNVCFFQFRLPLMPNASRNHLISVSDFPFQVYCPTSVRAFNHLPRPFFRLYERLLLWLYFRLKMLDINNGDTVIFHGCLGALHLCRKKFPDVKRWWLKLGLIEEESRSGFRYLWRKWIEKLNSRSFGRRLVVSQQMEKFLNGQYGTSPKGSYVLPCLVDLTRFSSSDRESARRELGLNDRFVLLYMGTAAPWQCVVETISFFRRVCTYLPEAFLWILTPDAEEFTHLLKSISKKDYRIEFRPHESIGHLIHAADVGLLLRQRDLINSVASPVKFPEYLACGLPVIIGPEVGDYSNLVRKKKLGVLVDPEYPDNWDREIGHLISLLNKDKSLRQRCREMARSLSWQFYKEEMQHEFGKTI